MPHSLEGFCIVTVLQRRGQFNVLRLHFLIPADVENLLCLSHCPHLLKNQEQYSQNIPRLKVAANCPGNSSTRGSCPSELEIFQSRVPETWSQSVKLLQGMNLVVSCYLSVFGCLGSTQLTNKSKQCNITQSGFGAICQNYSIIEVTFQDLLTVH